LPGLTGRRESVSLLLEIGKSKHCGTLGFSPRNLSPSLLLHFSGLQIPVVQVRLMPAIV